MGDQGFAEVDYLSAPVKEGFAELTLQDNGLGNLNEEVVLLFFSLFCAIEHFYYF